MSEYIVNTEDGANVASVEYNISIEPFMRIELATVTFNKDKAEKIVRCRDCRYNDPDREDNHRHFENACFYFADYEDTPAEVDPDGFCAWGERKSE